MTEVLGGKFQKASVLQHPITAPANHYQADILFLPHSKSKKYSAANDGHTSILLVVEIMTRFAYAIPLRRKSSEEVSLALVRIYEESVADHHPISNLTTDDGKEFNNAAIKNYCSKNGITLHIRQKGNVHALAIVDRLCRTLKESIDDFHEEHETYDWYHNLPKILDEYNDSQNRNLKASPDEMRENPVYAVMKQADIYKHGQVARSMADKFQEGDHVRVWMTAEDIQAIRVGKEGRRMHIVRVKGRSRWSPFVYVIKERRGYSFFLKRAFPSGISHQDYVRTYRHYEMKKVPIAEKDKKDFLQEIALESVRQSRRSKK